MKIRRLLMGIVFFALLVSLASTNAEASASAKKKALKAYAKFLKNYQVIDDPFANPRFTFVYIDNNNVPELIVANSYVHRYRVEIYTYVNNNVKKLGYFGAYGSVHYAEKKGIIKSANGWTGSQDIAYYRLKGGTAKRIKHFIGFIPEIEDKTLEYYIDGKKVSKKKYHSSLSKYDAKHKWEYVKYDDMTPLASSDINN